MIRHAFHKCFPLGWRLSTRAGWRPCRFRHQGYLGFTLLCSAGHPGAAQHRQLQLHAHHHWLAGSQRVGHRSNTSLVGHECTDFMHIIELDYSHMMSQHHVIGPKMPRPSRLSIPVSEWLCWKKVDAPDNQFDVPTLHSLFEESRIEAYSGTLTPRTVWVFHFVVWIIQYSFLFLLVRPGATSSFLLLVIRCLATSSVLAATVHSHAWCLA